MPWLRYARLAVALVFLVLVIWHVGSLRGILAEFGDVRLSLVAAAVILLPANILIQFFKWSFILRPVVPGAPTGSVLGSLLVGYTLGLVTPGGIGEMGRGLYIRELDRKKGVVLVFIDKLSNGLAIFVMGLAGLAVLAAITGRSILWTALWLALAVAGIAAAALFVWRRLDSGRQKDRPAGRRWLYHLAALLADLQVGSGARPVAILAYSLGFHLIFMVQFLLLLRAFSDYAWLPITAAALVAMAAKALLPVSAADLGVREGSAVFFLAMVQVAGAHAFSAAFLLFVINILLPAVIGLFLLPRLSPARRTGTALEVRKEYHASLDRSD